MKNIRSIQQKIARGDIRVEYACRNRAVSLRPWIIKVLSAIGRPEAFVTDESSVGDFRSSKPGNGELDPVEAISKNLGIRVNSRDLIVDVASKLRLNSLH